MIPIYVGLKSVANPNQSQSEPFPKHKNGLHKQRIITRERQDKANTSPRTKRRLCSSCLAQRAPTPRHRPTPQRPVDVGEGAGISRREWTAFSYEFLFTFLCCLIPFYSIIRTFRGKESEGDEEEDEWDVKESNRVSFEMQRTNSP